MKLTILHHDLENTEAKLEESLLEKGIDIQLIDIRDAQIEDFKDTDLVLNRVYASVANRDYPSIENTLIILKKLEEKGIKCLNSHKASFFDYNKFESSKIMEENGVLNPKTIFLNGGEPKIKEIVETLSFPIIVKRNTGGRGKDLAKCHTEGELINAISNIREEAEYNGGIVFQEFLEPAEDNDYRVWVIDNKISFYHKRSLIALNDNEKPWLASRSLGSKILIADEELSEEIKELAIKSTKAIKADLNVLDIIKTKKGYAVIENNPTPNLRPEYIEVIGFNPGEFLYKQITKACPLNEIEINVK
jgi:RimK family alpha-L-glutamate ligase